MTTTLLKTCTRCAGQFPATLEFFYKNAGGKYGVTPRCKPCVNIDNEASHAKRLSADTDKIRAQANARAKKSYHNNVEVNRAKQRDHQAKARQHPEKSLKIKARKRGGGAGLTPEEIEALLQAQDSKCAICNDPDPTDLDHCHTTGRVRFLLCKHCNRGLGAFRDNPSSLRKAADLLDQINDNQSTKPTQSKPHREHADREGTTSGGEPRAY